MTRALAITAALLISTAAYANDLPDWSDADTYQCTSPQVTLEVKALVEKSPAGRSGRRVLYLKNERELSRTSDALTCAVTLVANVEDMSGPFTVKFFNEDGHFLVLLSPGTPSKQRGAHR